MRNLLKTFISGSFVLAALVGCTSSSVSSSSLPPSELQNGGFEAGTLAHWTPSGQGAFEEGNVTSASTVQNVTVEKEGTYFYSGIEVSLPSFKGVLTSEPFVLNGIGALGVKLGAAKDSEKCYIEFFEKGNTTPLAFTLNQETTTRTKLGNFDFNGTTITDHLIRSVVDLSPHLEKQILIQVTDNDVRSDATDYSYFNLDDFKVLNTVQEKKAALDQRKEQLERLQEEPFPESPTTTRLRNGGFETGTLDGWKITQGNAFSEKNVILGEQQFWGNRAFHQEGAYLLNGFSSEEIAIGKIRSEIFLNEDKEKGGYVSFKIGGGKNTSACYVSIKEYGTNEEVVRISNTAFQDPAMSLNLHDVIVDLTAHKGKVLYFEVVDMAGPGEAFASISVDDFVINLTEEEVKTKVETLRAFAASNQEEATKAAYKALYTGGISFPLAGVAPTIVETDGIAYQTTIKPQDAVDITSYFPSLSYQDDYTATKEITIDVVNIEKDNKTLTVDSLYAMPMKDEGTYTIYFELKDAYQQTTKSKFTLLVDAAISYKNSIENGDFETGTLAGWQVSKGKIQEDKAISQEEVYWAEKMPFNKQGNYFFNGWSAQYNETDAYSLRSTTFTLSGSGFISFRMAGRSSAVKVYRANGTQIALYTNTVFRDQNFPNLDEGCRLATMTTFVADLTPYLGEDLYIELCDNDELAGWGVVFFDAIQTYYPTKPSIVGQSDTVTFYKNGDVTLDPIPYNIPHEEAVNAF